MGINIVETEGKRQLNVDNIEDSKSREEVKLTMENYTTNKTKSCEMIMKLVLKDEEPIYEHPRRLSNDEMKVETHLEEWLKEGIITPNSSD